MYVLSFAQRNQQIHNKYYSQPSKHEEQKQISFLLKADHQPQFLHQALTFELCNEGQNKSNNIAAKIAK